MMRLQPRVPHQSAEPSSCTPAGAAGNCGFASGPTRERNRGPRVFCFARGVRSAAGMHPFPTLHAEGGTRTHTPLRERDFESLASAGSATSARLCVLEAARRGPESRPAEQAGCLADGTDPGGAQQSPLGRAIRGESDLVRKFSVFALPLVSRRGAPVYNPHRLAPTGTAGSPASRAWLRNPLPPFVATGRPTSRSQPEGA